MSPTRRDFLKATGAIAASTAFGAELNAQQATRRRYAIVGTGVRAIGMWGRPLAARFADRLEFVGLCDINPKRVELAARPSASRARPSRTSIACATRRGPIC